MATYRYNEFNTRVFEQIPVGASILDIGCDTGLLGKEVKNTKTPKKLIGIEIDKRAAKLARKYYDKVYTFDLDTQRNFRMIEKSFDCIVLADVLEHLKDPSVLLKHVKKYLKYTGGILIISIPNVLFILNRLQILFGRFDYSDKGTMDKTHLRFFTAKSIQALVRDAGFTILHFRGYVNTRPVLKPLDLFAKFLPSLFAYQFLLVVKPFKS